MKNQVFFIAILIALFSCKRSVNTLDLPDLPYLKVKETNHFKVGDKFIFAESYNSCCMYCILKNDAVSEYLLNSSLFEFKETIEDPADPNCAGCSSYYYSIFECIAPGIDSFSYYTIPMGQAGFATNCFELSSNIFDEIALRNYVVSVSELY